jgi:hypothetical protein
MRSGREVRVSCCQLTIVATVFDSIPASSDTVEAEAWQIKHC